MPRDFRLYLDDILCFSISSPIVWDIVQNKLGPLEAACKKILNKLEDTNSVCGENENPGPSPSATCPISIGAEGA